MLIDRDSINAKINKYNYKVSSITEKTNLIKINQYKNKLKYYKKLSMIYNLGGADNNSFKVCPEVLKLQNKLNKQLEDKYIKLEKTLNKEKQFNKQLQNKYKNLEIILNKENSNHSNHLKSIDKVLNL